LQFFGVTKFEDAQLLSPIGARPREVGRHIISLFPTLRIFRPRSFFLFATPMPPDDDFKSFDDRPTLIRAYLDSAQNARRAARHITDPRTRTLLHQLADLWVKLASRKMMLVIVCAMGLIGFYVAAQARSDVRTQSVTAAERTP
jgi:hypothetical protein